MSYLILMALGHLIAGWWGVLVGFILAAAIEGSRNPPDKED